MRVSDAHLKTGLSARTEVIPEAVGLMHAYIRDLSCTTVVAKVRHGLDAKREVWHTQGKIM
jgi:hypothetical protein